MRPPFHLLLPCNLFPIRCPAFPAGTVLPSFNGFRTIRKAEYQGVFVLHPYSRYFTVEAIQTTNNLLGGGNQNIFRDLLGLAECFPFGVECGADPYRTGGSVLASVMFVAPGTDQQTGEWIFTFVPVRYIMLFWQFSGKAA